MPEAINRSSEDSASKVTPSPGSDDAVEMRLKVEALRKEVGEPRDADEREILKAVGVDILVAQELEVKDPTAAIRRLQRSWDALESIRLRRSESDHPQAERADPLKPVTPRPSGTDGFCVRASDTGQGVTKYTAENIRAIEKNSGKKGKSRWTLGVILVFIIICFVAKYVGGELGKRAAAKDAIRGEIASRPGHKRFDTKDHPKALGVHFALEYPEDWVASEGDRPHIVQKFRQREGMNFITIIVRSFAEVTQGVLTDSDRRTLICPPLDCLPDGAKRLSLTATKIDGEPAEMDEITEYGERAGTRFFMHSLSFRFIQGTTIVEVRCSVGGPAGSEREVSDRMTACRPLFLSVATSIVFPQKWK